MMSSFHTGPTTSLHRDGDHGSVAVEAVLATEPAQLWQALTDTERLARWLCVVDGTPRVGEQVRLWFTTGWQGTGVVQECEEPRRIVVLTTEDADESGEPAESTTVTATLAAADGGTLLRIEESGLPVGTLPALGAGWQLHLEDLGSVLAGETPDNAPERMGARWQALAPSMEQAPVQDRAEK